MRLLRAYPNGGAELARRLAELMRRDPRLGRDVTCLSRYANKLQTLAIAAAFNIAIHALEDEDPTAARRLRECLACGTDDLRELYAAAEDAAADASDPSGAGGFFGSFYWLGRVIRPYGFGQRPSPN